MRINSHHTIACVLALLGAFPLVGSSLANEQTDSETLQPFIDALNEKGADPVDFVLASLARHDLLIFDDALHNATDPFDFYQKLVTTPEFVDLVKYVFVELPPINFQPDLDKYFQTSPADPRLLYPVFQNSSDNGLAYKSYFDLMKTIHEVNATLAEEEQIVVVATSDPSTWSQIENAQDLEIARKDYFYRDHLMYKFILEGLDRFNSDKKGIFLTNTRHAYTGVRRADGSLYWNTATFFDQWHPGKSISIRFHNASLHLENTAPDPNAVTKSSGGGRKVSWIRMGDGIWDSAFAATGDQSVALTLRGTPFGEHAYTGNHMLNAQPGQTMADAYDAVIFLAPLEKLRKTAQLSELYTKDFRHELARRYRIMYSSEELAEHMARFGYEELENFIAWIAEPKPESPLPQIESLGSINAWRSGQ